MKKEFSKRDRVEIDDPMAAAVERAFAKRRTGDGTIPKKAGGPSISMERDLICRKRFKKLTPGEMHRFHGQFDFM